MKHIPKLSKVPCLNKHKGDTWPIPGWLVVMVVDGWEVINFNSVERGKIECNESFELVSIHDIQNHWFRLVACYSSGGRGCLW